jgi:dUTP pyrophosphatase
MKLKIKKIKDNAIIPKYENEGDVGLDLCSTEKYLLKPGERCLVSTGIQTEFPVGYEMQIRARSGLAYKKGISVVNGPGTIDAGYRGEIGVVIINHGDEDFEINPGDKIAQAVLNKVEIADVEVVGELNDSERGENNFGSSGMRGDGSNESR